MGHEPAPVNPNKLVPHGCLVLFQLDAAMESSDVDERVGRSEGFSCHVHPPLQAWTSKRNNDSLFRTFLKENGTAFTFADLLLDVH